MAYDFNGTGSLLLGVEETLMPASYIAASLDPEAYDAVFTALLEYHPYDTISTRTVLGEVRRLAPDCPLPDDDMIALIVQMATGTTMAVSFDQREAA
jgi:hypothetical protein